MEAMRMLVNGKEYLPEVIETIIDKYEIIYKERESRARKLIHEFNWCITEHLEKATLEQLEKVLSLIESYCDYNDIETKMEEEYFEYMLNTKRHEWGWTEEEMEDYFEGPAAGMDIGVMETEETTRRCFAIYEYIQETFGKKFDIIQYTEEEDKRYAKNVDSLSSWTTDSDIESDED